MLARNLHYDIGQLSCLFRLPRSLFVNDFVPLVNFPQGHPFYQTTNSLQRINQVAPNMF